MPGTVFHLRKSTAAPVEGSYPTNEFLITDHDTIPNFAKNATILSVATGDASSTSTWNPARLPTDDDIVGIQNPHVVTWDLNSTARITAVGIAGTLKAARNATTKLMCQHLLIYGAAAAEGGVEGWLDQGTSGDPVQAGNVTEIVILNVAIDTGTVAAPGEDIQQYGNGIIAFGRWTAHGQAKTPFARVSVEPQDTETSFTFPSAPTNWAVSDRLVISDTRQLSIAGGTVHAGYTSQWEERAITSLAGSGTIANFTGGLAYDHLGVRLEDNTLDRLPHVANLSRNVIIRSEDGTAVRGHVFMTHRARIDLRHIQASQTGRTTNANLHSTYINDITAATNSSPIQITYAHRIGGVNLLGGETITIAGVEGNTAANGTHVVSFVSFDPPRVNLNGTTGNGEYTGGGEFGQVGTNQIGRYFHCHHLYGPIGGLGYEAAVDPDEFKPGDPANILDCDGPSYRLIDVVIEDPLPAAPSVTMPASKWGLAIHDSHCGFIKDCVIHHYAGSGIVTEDGSESYNVIDGLYAGSIFGDVDQRQIDMRSGSGITFQGYKNWVRNCVSCGNHGLFSGIVNGSGFYYSTPPTGSSVRMPLYQGADLHDGAEGVEYEIVNRRDVAILQNKDNEAYGAISTGLSIWHLGSDGGGATATARSTVQGLIVWNAFEEAYFGYPTDMLTIDGLIARKTGTYGITWGDYWQQDTIIQNCDIQGVWIGIGNNLSVHGTLEIRDSYLNCSGANLQFMLHATPGTGAGGEDHAVTIDNCTYGQWGAEAGFYNILMDYTLAHAKTNLRVRQTVNVIDHNGTPGDNLQLYYAEQAEDFEMPISTGDPTFLTACPEAGLTNAQAYVAYNQDGTPKTGGSLADPTGCCIGGVIAFTAELATPRADIDGLVKEL